MAWQAWWVAERLVVAGLGRQGTAGTGGSWIGLFRQARKGGVWIGVVRRRTVGKAWQVRLGEFRRGSLVRAW